ncbi:MAG TPA: GWxTD domain-containing protein [Candidatus Eisenbacteria bacterium]
MHLPAREARAAHAWSGLRLGVLLAGAVLAGGALAGSARASEKQEGPPPWRVGGRTGFTCDVAAFPDTTGYHLEVYLRVPPATLQQLEADQHGDAQLRALVKVKAHGADELESSQEFSISLADTARGQGRVLLMRFPVTPGACRITARLEDLLSRKRGIAYSGRNSTQNTELRGDVELPRPQAGRDLSDFEFVWPTPGRAPGLAFVRGGQARVPDPDRLYGLYAPVLEAAFTARSRPGDERPWRWVVRVLDPQGRVVAQQDSASAAGRQAEGGVRFDLADQPAGAYLLDAKVWQEGDAGALQRRSKFSIGWSPDTWQRNAADVADDVHFLLEARDEEEFTGLQPGEQEKLLGEFWKKRDPTPETATNEAYLTFRERVDHANEQFSRFAIAKGMFSDMGRVYIRYGAPTEILHQVMPAGDETLSKALEDIMSSETRAVGEVNQKGPGGDQRPYEIWIYEGEIPLPFDVDPATAADRGVKRRLLFLFVDEQGLGTFTLRYSTE